MGKLSKFQQLSLDGLGPESAGIPASSPVAGHQNGTCPFWPDCHGRWHVSDKYRCAWRRDHHVLLCGTYKARRKREVGE